MSVIPNFELFSNNTHEKCFSQNLTEIVISQGSRVLECFVKEVLKKGNEPWQLL